MERGDERRARFESRRMRIESHIAELESGEFGVFFRKDKRENRDPEETELSQEFENILISVEIPDEIMDKEVRFIRKVLEAVDRFDESDEFTILWDVDDTIGKNDGEQRLRFRPCYLALLDFIHDKFPNADHGLLTDRSNWENSKNKAFIDVINGHWELNPEKMFSSLRSLPDDIDRFITRYRVLTDDLFSVLSMIDEAEAAKKIFIDVRKTIVGSKMGTIHKAAKMYEMGILKDDSIIVVDDCDLPLFLGDRGVFVDFNSRARSFEPED